MGGKGELEDCSWLFFEDEPPDGELASESPPKIAPRGDGVDAERCGKLRLSTMSALPPAPKIEETISLIHTKSHLPVSCAKVSGAA